MLALSVYSTFATSSFSFNPHTATTDPISPDQFVRRATYFLNFSLLDSNDQSFVHFGLQFYINSNSTNNSDGFGQIPILVTNGSPSHRAPDTGQPQLLYIRFLNGSGVYVSYVFYNNYSQPIHTIKTTGNPPNDRYFYTYNCGFTCALNSSSSPYPQIVNINITGYDPHWYRAYSFWFWVQGVRLIYSDLSVIDLPDLRIVVNGTMTEQNTTEVWTITPNVSISGAPFTSNVQYPQTSYAIYTGVPDPLNRPGQFTLVEVLIIATLLIGVSIFIESRLKKYGISTSRGLITSRARRVIIAVILGFLMFIVLSVVYSRYGTVGFPASYALPTDGPCYTRLPLATTPCIPTTYTTYEYASAAVDLILAVAVALLTITVINGLRLWEPSDHQNSKFGDVNTAIRSYSSFFS
jgi:hypothetical protein